MSSFHCRPLPVTGIAQQILASEFRVWQIFFMQHEVLSQALAAYETPYDCEQSSPGYQWELTPGLFPQLTLHSQGK